MQAKELQGIRRSLVCGRCGRNTVSPRVATSPAKTPKTPLSSSRTFRPVPQLKSPDKQVAPGHDVWSLRNTRHSTRTTPVVRKASTTITPTQPSQAVSDPASQPGETSVPSQLSASNVDPDSGTMHRNPSILFNKEVEKELDMELAHVLLHGDTIWCVKFSKDGKYVAAGCKDGKTYIYDVQTGKLTW